MTTDTGIRSLETTRNDGSQTADIITKIYDGSLDIAVLRGAFPNAEMAALASTLDRPDAETAWSRPNAVIPTEDVFILGTDTPATPTCKAPRGASLEAYLRSASNHAAAVESVAPVFDTERAMAAILREVSGNRPVEVAVSADGRRYTPYTFRLLKAGKQLSVHHDYHYPLALYQDLSQRLDTGTLVSFFLTLQRPSAGGALIVYDLNSDDPRQPMLPNGWWDLKAMEERFEHSRFDLLPGDFVLLASGRRFHRVEPVSGAQPRITLGGFLALEKKRERVLFWS